MSLSLMICESAIFSPLIFTCVYARTDDCSHSLSFLLFRIHGLPKSLSESINNDINFVKSLHTSLKDEGVLVVRGVDGRTVKDVPVRHAVDAVSDIKNGSLLRSLETVGFEETRHYQEVRTLSDNHRVFVVITRFLTTCPSPRIVISRVTADSGHLKSMS